MNRGAGAFHEHLAARLRAPEYVERVLRRDALRAELAALLNGPEPRVRRIVPASEVARLEREINEVGRELDRMRETFQNEVRLAHAS